jgi:hypothetical protein
VVVLEEGPVAALLEGWMKGPVAALLEGWMKGPVAALLEGWMKGPVAASVEDISGSRGASEKVGGRSKRGSGEASSLTR